MLVNRVVPVLLVFITFALCVSGQVSQCSNNDLISIVPTADVKFSVIRTLKGHDAAASCTGRPSVESVQNVALIQWLVERMNNNSHVRGVTIGADIYDDCGVPRRSLGRALDVVDGPILGTSRCTNSTVPCHIGILGASLTSTTESILYGLQDSSLTVLSPYASSVSLTNRHNFYRTANSDLLYLQAIVSLLEKVELTYVAVVHINNTFGTEMAALLKHHAKARGICVDSVQAITTGSDINLAPLHQQRKRTKDNTLRVVFLGHQPELDAMMKELQYRTTTNLTWVIPNFPGDKQTDTDVFMNVDTEAFILAPGAVSIADAETYLNDKWQRVIDSQNPSKLDDVEQLMLQTGLDDVPLIEDNHVRSTVDAVFVFISSLQRQRDFLCRPDEALCDALKTNFKSPWEEIRGHPVVYSEITPNVTIGEFAGRKVDFYDSGEFKSDENANIFSIKLLNNGSSSKIGNFRNGTFSYDSSVSLEIDVISTSKCNDSCPMCVDSPEVQFSYTPGDSLLLGILSMHETDPGDPFRCSQFRTSQMDVINLETFLNTVDKMRTRTGINFGAIVIDDCYSSARVSFIVSQLFTGDVVLRDPDTDKVIDFRNVVAVVNAGGSGVNIPLALLMTELNIPVISAAASSPDLDDRVNFPYFLRTVPSDVDQAKVMVSIVEAMGWDYVSVLYTENNYGTKGSSAFIEQAEKRGICIAEDPQGIVDVADNKTVNALSTVLKAIQRQNTDVVVYFGTETRIANFLEVMNSDRKFIFIGSEDWGDRKYIIDTAGQAAKGSMTLKNQFRPGVVQDVNLTEYIRNLKPSTNLRNPWFTEYWEEIFKCDLPQTFHNKYNKVCQADLQISDDYIQEIVSDQRITHTITAVMAVTQGLKKAKDEFCKLSTFPCDKYFLYIDEVVNFIKQETVDDVRVFNDDGNGNIGFIINNVQEVDGGLDYVEVGSFEGHLNIQKHKVNFYLTMDGTCPEGQCDHCGNNSVIDPITMVTTTHSHPVENEFSIPEYTIIGILALLFVVMVIFFVIIVCCLKKRLIELQYELKKTTRELRTAEYISSKNTGSSLTDIQNDVLAYPEMQFVNTGSPSGESLYNLQKTQQYLDKNRRVGNGFVNNGFVGDHLYIHPQSAERSNEANTSSANHNHINSSPQNITRSSPNIQSSESSPYKPTSKSSYGVTTHSSFKKPADYQSHKMQPRTQLAVPPCRPELPPRDQQDRLNEHAHRTQNFPDHFNEVSVPKERVRKQRSNPKRMMSPSQRGPSPDDKSHHTISDDIESPRYAGSPKGLNFKPDYLISPEQAIPSADMINFHGSMEKISRV